MARNPTRTILLIVMNLLIVLAVVVTAALVIGFFGTLAAQTWGQAVLKIADAISLPTGIAPIKTPYGGVFSIDYALTIAALLLGEWIIGSLRGRA